MNLEENTSLEEISTIPFWKADENILKSESAGESNMNVVVRVTTNLRSVIIKQSKPYVNKFPQIPAPIERVNVEHEFFKVISKSSTLRNYSPQVLKFIPEQHLLITEDLGKGSDFGGIYHGDFNLSKTEVNNLSEYLIALHELEPKEFPDNTLMKKLNHEHIFSFPFQVENGFDLDSVQYGLQELSLKYKTNIPLKRKIEELGKRYLKQGETLLHGDFYPGSWLKTEAGLKVIDPEFAFLGDPEFDLGVLFAHLDLGQQPEEVKTKILHTYALPLSPELLNQYQGVELLRRLIGIAQLPLNMTLDQKESLLVKAEQLILS
ncbi:phosphotransferase [Algoriphagus halophilus]|uniref:5-methylthioribose kinase n=1 Tax=Algoriphagus halophilus TaxID=226505 RepID=A0A1N6E5T5_9BACT|nr:phosphotransferase [Algoriphagus halophilus]SIN78343.1 5-methylthioribose kinase [Algoriphagus halophilus]